ncbi:MAG TPA: DegV family protein, partial [Candidatus Binataceae bacterium]|nr:DegV family protein [Candidatus Binataceae bacterium]
MPQPLSIVSDSSIDLPAEELRRLGIETAPIQVAFSTDYVRDDALNRGDFYRRLPAEPRLPTIAAALPTDFLATFRKAHERGAEVLCLINPFESCSTYTSAYTAAVIAKRDSQITVEVMNTGRALTGLGAIAIEAAEMALRGASMAEVVGAIEEATPQIDTLLAPATSEFLVRDGRISIYEMEVGSLHGMLPLVRVWGRVAVVDKAKTQADNVAKMLARAEQELNGHEATVIVTHADNPSGARALAEQVSARLKVKRLVVSELGP